MCSHNVEPRKGKAVDPTAPPWKSHFSLTSDASARGWPRVMKSVQRSSICNWPEARF